jgi:hypothetical protein
MVVGRTLWDFIIELARTPGIGLVILAAFILLELLLAVILLLIHSGLITVRLSWGGLGIEASYLAMILEPV